MTRSSTKTIGLSGLILVLMMQSALAQDAALTYQGQLRMSGEPFTGTPNLEFRLYDQLSEGSQIGSAQTRLGWPVEDGLFQVELDFGPSAFDGSERFLEVRVDGAPLIPRQKVTATPYALLAAGIAAGTVDSDAIDPAEVQLRVVGTCPTGEYVTEVNQDGSVVCGVDQDSGGTVTSINTGAGLAGGPITDSGTISVAPGGIGTTEIDPVQVQRRVVGTCPAGQYVRIVNQDGSVTCGTDEVGISGWNLTGNAGTDPVTDFIGTTDATAVEVRTQNVRSLRIEPSAELFEGLPITTNVIAGSHANVVADGVRGATIAGGGVPAGDSDPDHVDENPNQVNGHYGTVGGGYANTAGDSLAVDDSEFATVSGGEGNSASSAWSAVGGGQGNIASELWSAVGGGYFNTASDFWSTVAGGNNNIASGFESTVGGGSDNTASASRTTIGGGDENIANANESTVGGGDRNIASGIQSTIGGGGNNTASGTSSTVGGGSTNMASGSSSTVGGGALNTASSTWSTVGGGGNHTASGGSSTVGGGGNNTASGSGSTVAGGGANTASGSNSTVGGGLGNDAIGSSTTVAGGQDNIANSSFGTVGGGADNFAHAQSTVAGGVLNRGSGFASSVGGGQTNTASGSLATVGGGTSNTARGSFATVGGGFENCAAGDYSWAGGRRAKIRLGFATVPDDGIGCDGIPASGDMDGDNGTFVWADDQDADFVSSGENQFLVRASGGVGLGTNAPVAQLHVREAINSFSTLGNHVAVIENNAAFWTSGPDVLALKTAPTTPDDDTNFITFFNGNDQALGRIEGDGSGGITLLSGGADFAEWLPKRSVDESIEPGDVIGWHEDGISRDTRGALRVMAVSTRQIVAGNAPPDDERDDWAPIGFIGQVPVNVIGPVAAGDWIIPSGFEDGTGVAVSPETIAPGQIARVIGQALESANRVDPHQVNVAIGLGLDSALGDALIALQSLNDVLRKRLAEVESRQDEEMEALRTELAMLRELIAPQLATGGQ